MTAVSLILRPQEAYLLTDGAMYDREGTVLAIQSKVAYSAELRLAFAVSGVCTAYRVAQRLEGSANLWAALDRLPDAARAIQADQATLPGYDPAIHADFQVFGVGYSERHGHTIGFTLSTNEAWFGPGYPTFRVNPCEQVIGPAIRSGGIDARRFRPAIDGLAILEEQRRSRNWPEGCFIGGFGELTTVTRDAVWQDRLVTWNDRVGERIAV